MFNLRMLLSCFISYLIFSDKRVFYLNLNITRLVRSDIRNWVTLVCTLIYGKRMHYSPTSSNGHLHNVHLSTAATFLADRPYIDLVSTYLQRPPLYSGHFFSGQSIHWLVFQPIYNGHLSTMETFFCPQGGRFREVQNHLRVEATYKSCPRRLYRYWKWGHATAIRL